jgi:hypothetical protein
VDFGTPRAVIGSACSPRSREEREESNYSIQEKDSESRRRLLTVGMVIEGRAEQTAHAGLIRI